MILGLNRTQDASICVLEDGCAVCIQKERLSRQKHHWGKLGDIRELYAPALSALRGPVDLVVECYSSDAERAKMAEYQKEIKAVLTFRNGVNIRRISHHFAHLYSAYFASGFHDAAAMVIDFMGSPAAEFTESVAAVPPSPVHVEVASFYDCAGGEVRCLAKQTWDGNRAAPVGLGCFYFYLTQCFFPGEGNEGKVMALASYGDPDGAALPPLQVSGFEVGIPHEWLRLFEGRKQPASFLRQHALFEQEANVAAAGQRAFENALLQVTSHLAAVTGRKALCYAGGTALNCVANHRIATASRFEEVFIPPAPGDGGTALGCALYGAQLLEGRRSTFRWTDDFLGPTYTPEAVSKVLHDCHGFVRSEPADLAGEVAEILARGEVLGLWDGSSEFGPRALGHRSIIADPRDDNTRRWINENVKGRELFRPLAPVVIEEEAGKYFVISGPLPFMQYAVPVRAEKRGSIPAVTHIDSTARVQTVNATSHPFLYAVLKRFGSRTGVPVLINTSFNGKDEPIVETLQEALNCTRKSKLHGLVVPPYLLLPR